MVPFLLRAHQSNVLPFLVVSVLFVPSVSLVTLGGERLVAGHWLVHGHMFLQQQHRDPACSAAAVAILSPLPRRHLIRTICFPGGTGKHETLRTRSLHGKYEGALTASEHMKKGTLTLLISIATHLTVQNQTIFEALL